MWCHVSRNYKLDTILFMCYYVLNIINILGVYMSKFRNRNMLLLFYCEDSTHMEAYEKLTRTYDYVSILHDRDLYTEADEQKNPNNKAGTIKKPHIHAFVSFKNAKWSSAVSEDIGLDINYFEEPKSAKNTMLYLLHFNEPEKTQYEYSELKGPLKSRVASIINGMTQTEGEKVGDLISFIKSYDKKLNITDFAVYCAQNGYWSEFRRSATIFIKIIEEHNNKIQHNIKE